MKRKLLSFVFILIILIFNTYFIFASESPGLVDTPTTYSGGEVSVVENGHANDYYSSGWPWFWYTEDIKSVTEIEEGPERGADYSGWRFFCPSPHEQESASMWQYIYLKGDYKDLAEEGQLYGKASFCYSGWDIDNDDWCEFSVTARTSKEKDKKPIFGSDEFYYVDHEIASWNTGVKVGREEKKWFTASVNSGNAFKIPINTEYFYLYILGIRENGSDLDTYFDSITLLLYDGISPAVDENAWEIFRNGKAVNKGDWLKVGDKLEIKVKFSEELTIPNNAKLKLNIKNGENIKYADYVSKYDFNEIIAGINHEKTVATFKYTVSSGDEIINSDIYREGILPPYITYFSDASSPFENIKDKGNNIVKFMESNIINNAGLNKDPKNNLFYKQNISIDTDIPNILKNNSINYEIYKRNYGEIPIKITQSNETPQSDITINYQYCSYYDNDIVYKEGSVGPFDNDVFVEDSNSEYKLVNIPSVNDISNEINDKCLLIVIARDEARNISNELQIIVNQEDKKGPDISLNYPKTEGQEERLEYKQNQIINVTVNDEKNRIKDYKIQYFWSTSESIDDTIWKNTEIIKTLGIIESEPSEIEVNNQTGDYYLHVKAEDDVGNSTVKTSELVKLDNTMPSIYFEPPNDTVSNSEKSIGITVKDEHNGETIKDSIKYQIIRKDEETGEYEEHSGDWNSLNEEDIIENINGEIKEYKYNLNIDVMNTAQYKLLVKATDGLGNSLNIQGAEHEEYDFIFDTLGPEISLSYNEEGTAECKRDHEVLFSIGEQYS